MKDIFCGVISVSAYGIHEVETEGNKTHTMRRDGAKEGSTELYTASFGNT